LRQKGQLLMDVRGGSRLVLRRAPGNPAGARLIVGGRVFRAAIGRSGVRAVKREGDGGTPRGRLALRQVLCRADRGPRPCTMLPVRAIRPDDGWCEDPESPNYNRLVRMAPGGTADRLQRDDHLYDLIVVLGHNDGPRAKGRGSAIFMHLAREGMTPTAGCIALSRPDLLAVLRSVRRGSFIEVMA
jgi:L,D-peptidoglycan transpeptidase YkuD (ErfK/YbiS/YcfS/YnhG family)